MTAAIAFCPACGTKLLSNARFCAGCGAAVAGPHPAADALPGKQPGPVHPAAAVSWRGNVSPAKAPVTAFTPAGLARRCLAHLLDAGVAVFFVYTIAGETIESVVLPILAWIAYFVFMEAFWRGQTLGKKLCGIRVVARDGQRAGFGRILVRNLLRIVDASLLYLVALFSPNRRRLGDLLAGTIVVVTTKDAAR